MKDILLFIHQLPQNIVGWLLVKITKAEVKWDYIDGEPITFYIAHKFNTKWSGVSLGKFIVFSRKYCAYEISIKHEHGHQRQSLYLGWFYLLLIGIPSFIGNLLHRVFKFNYYRQPWEWWADKLGGVERA